MQAVIKEARQTLLLAVPIVIGQVGLMLMGVTDSVMIGRVGTVPLAASSFGGGVFNIFFIVGVGLLAPVAIFASRARGRAATTRPANTSGTGSSCPSSRASRRSG